MRAELLQCSRGPDFSLLALREVLRGALNPAINSIKPTPEIIDFVRRYEAAIDRAVAREWNR